MSSFFGFGFGPRNIKRRDSWDCTVAYVEPERKESSFSTASDAAAVPGPLPLKKAVSADSLGTSSSTTSLSNSFLQRSFSTGFNPEAIQHDSLGTK
uniref:Uncharacterized protein n=1 Tax=Chromera velia CCMP2878 TaxID=1169474 RepID=A0A0G4GTG6_9ALVE|eukprot:Cvel_23242.t1-p1 / transcript=Cvel_23242.t1 / gene=Cvel_23242 / organism=Chromera_velia_CCMP2878 / gene_product=hypothetical protein / transcript_product=hypothetical protein / location=Cvel_scaffold2374:13710-14648(+) / protein_length=95 / sequence_SO=supercontig / SO=protein_coding / is_pseudo=false